MKTQLFIPDKCKVGLQLRAGTYTGKLGYIIYHDGKVWRKEKSWEGWRHKEGNPHQEGWGDNAVKTIITGVEPIEFMNEPTEGFVLNKKAGGYSTGWDHRQTYCRVYDPRGWEFEITIPNLLFILEECSAYKGKGLEGEFVYAWDGKDLVLLPVSSVDYQECLKFTKLQDKKVLAKEMVEGCRYLTSKQEELVYLGRYPVYERYGNYLSYERDEESESNKPVKKYVFWSEDGYEHFIFLSGLTSIKAKVSDVINPKFSFHLDEFLTQTRESSRAINLELRDLSMDEASALFGDSPYSHSFYVKKGFDRERYKSNYVTIAQETDNYKATGKFTVTKPGVRTGGSYWNNRWTPDIKIEIGISLSDVVRDYGFLVRVYENGYKIDA